MHLRGLICLALLSWAAAQPTARSVAVIAPVHEPKYHFAVRLAASLLEHDIAADLCLVVKFRAETPVLTNLLPRDDRVRVLAQQDGVEGLMGMKNVILVKKWWAVSQLLDTYAYFLLIDSEAEFVKHTNLAAVVEYVHNLGLVFGVGTNTWDFIMRDSAWRYSDAEREALRARLNDWKLYLWWNELPVVESSAARAFLNCTKMLESSTDSAVHEFDYIPYIYWMMLHHGWTAVDLSATIPDVCDAGSLSECGGGTRDTLLRSQPHWVQHSFWVHARAKYADADLDVVMTFHHDRTP